MKYAGYCIYRLSTYTARDACGLACLHSAYAQKADKAECMGLTSLIAARDACGLACLHSAYAQKADKAECMGLLLSPSPPYRSPPKGGALKIKKEARKNPNLLTQKRQVIIWPSFNYCRFRAVQFLHHKIHMR